VKGSKDELKSSNVEVEAPMTGRRL